MAKKDKKFTSSITSVARAISVARVLKMSVLKERKVGEKIVEKNYVDKNDVEDTEISYDTESEPSGMDKGRKETLKKEKRMKKKVDCSSLFQRWSKKNGKNSNTKQNQRDLDSELESENDDVKFDTNLKVNSTSAKATEVEKGEILPQSKTSSPTRQKKPRDSFLSLSSIYSVDSNVCSQDCSESSLSCSERSISHSESSLSCSERSLSRSERNFSRSERNLSRSERSRGNSRRRSRSRRIKNKNRRKNVDCTTILDDPLSINTNNKPCRIKNSVGKRNSISTDTLKVDSPTTSRGRQQQLSSKTSRREKRSTSASRRNLQTSSKSKKSLLDDLKLSTFDLNTLDDDDNEFDKWLEEMETFVEHVKQLGYSKEKLASMYAKPYPKKDDIISKSKKKEPQGRTSGARAA